MYDYNYSGYVSITIDEYLDNKLVYAQALADKCIHLASVNSEFAHSANAWGSGLSEHVAVIRGQVPKRAKTSFGNLDFLDTGIRSCEAILKKAAIAVISAQRKESGRLG